MSVIQWNKIHLKENSHKLQTFLKTQCSRSIACSSAHSEFLSLAGGLKREPIFTETFNNPSL